MIQSIVFGCFYQRFDKRIIDDRLARSDRFSFVTLSRPAWKFPCHFRAIWTEITTETWHLTYSLCISRKFRRLSNSNTYCCTDCEKVDCALSLYHSVSPGCIWYLSYKRVDVIPLAQQLMCRDDGTSPGWQVLKESGKTWKSQKISFNLGKSGNL